MASPMRPNQGSNHPRVLESRWNHFHNHIYTNLRLDQPNLNAVVDQVGGQDDEQEVDDEEATCYGHRRTNIRLEERRIELRRLPARQHVADQSDHHGGQRSRIAGHGVASRPDIIRPDDW